MEEQIQTQTQDIAPGGDSGVQQPETNAADDGTQQAQVYRTQEDVDRAIKDRLKRAEKEWRKKDPANQFFERAGMDPSSALQAWENNQAQALVNEGYDPAIAQQIASAQAAAMKAQQGLADTRLDVEETRFTAQLEKEGLATDYDEVKDEVRDLARKTGIGLAQAYYAIRGPKALERVRHETEQKTITRLKEKAARGVESGEGGGDLERLGLSAAEIATANKWGMDPREYAAMKGAHDLDSYRALKKKG